MTPIYHCLLEDTKNGAQLTLRVRALSAEKHGDVAADVAQAVVARVDILVVADAGQRDEYDDEARLHDEPRDTGASDPALQHNVRRRTPVAEGDGAHVPQAHREEDEVAHPGDRVAPVVEALLAACPGFWFHGTAFEDDVLPLLDGLHDRLGHARDDHGKDHDVAPTGAEHACHVRARLPRDLDPQLTPYRLRGFCCCYGQVVSGLVESKPWVGHVHDADGRGGGGGVVEGGRDEELRYYGVEEDLRHLLVAQVALVLLVHLVRVGQRDEGVPVTRLHLRGLLHRAGRHDAVVLNVLAEEVPVLRRIDTASSRVRHCDRSTLQQLHCTGARKGERREQGNCKEVGL
eukprot:scaffold87325_cov48-Phaeocystis_antarctica.AAC.7